MIQMTTHKQINNAKNGNNNNLNNDDNHDYNIILLKQKNKFL